MTTTACDLTSRIIAFRMCDRPAIGETEGTVLEHKVLHGGRCHVLTVEVAGWADCATLVWSQGGDNLSNDTWKVLA